MNLVGWGLGLTASYFMGIILGWGGIGIWVGMVLSLLLCVVILMLRFDQVIANKIANSDDGEESQLILTDKVLKCRS
ncbi:MAG: hypothetical protein ACHBN1_30515 [Heteroscytonema crispum UTEX LB 1556]|uniref:SxtM2 n=2 Tax=Heteroscytonema crispum TaxID=439476 RepID=A0A3G2KSN2_9CYAN|nr:SxtM2 [Heteroscytonema crispum UCFS10]AYN62325.1 SxtM2 [Heteroscytonema crispum UCFS15]